LDGARAKRFPDLIVFVDFSGTYLRLAHLFSDRRACRAAVNERADFGRNAMGSTQSNALGPDLAEGVAADDVADGHMLAGHVDQEPVLLARRGDEYFAIGATCSHYGGPLAQGLMVEDTVRCPWHHACFSLRTGEALRAPALSPVACWEVERRDGKVFVGDRKVTPAPKRSHVAAPRPGSPEKIVIVGGGAAGFAAAEQLRREQWQGSIVMLSDDEAPPVDRPNLSKDYLAGSAPEDWIPLRPESFYAENGIELRLRANVAAIDGRASEVALANGDRVPYDRLLLATGAEPVRLSIPGADLPHVCVLRSLADCRAIIARAASAQRVVVLGASFIGLEVAAALRARKLEVHVVAPEKRRWNGSWARRWAISCACCTRSTAWCFIWRKPPPPLRKIRSC
jgi:nitrite reductase/ring-hydroxylating ferredoxin subunit